MAIGDPVVAEDKDGDVLTYTLGGTRRRGIRHQQGHGPDLKTKGGSELRILVASDHLHCHGQGDGPGGRTPWPAEGAIVDVAG